MQGRFAFAQQKTELLTKPIPSTGERLPVIGIGTARRYDVGTDEKERGPIREVLQNLPKLGGKLVDTAPSYGNAEQVIGDILAELKNRDRIFLATKVGVDTREEGVAQIEESFRKLRTNRIDLIAVHNLRDTDNQLAILRDLKSAGRIRAIGLTTSSDRQYEPFEAAMRREALDSIQVDYALDNRNAAERILPLAQEKGLAVFINLPFGRDRLFSATRDRPLPDWATDFGCRTWAQFSLKYILSNPLVTCVLTETSNPKHMAENADAAFGRLPNEDERRRMREFIAAL